MNTNCLHHRIPEVSLKTTPPTIHRQESVSPEANQRGTIHVHVVESTRPDQSRVNVDGSGCLTLHNRCLLCAYAPATHITCIPQLFKAAPHTASIEHLDQHSRTHQPQSHMPLQLVMEERATGKVAVHTSESTYH